jgi:hypothetical protein
MARMRFRASVLVFSLLGWSVVVSAQNVSTGAEGLTVKGFVNATAFLENQNFTFGNGQNAEFPNPPQTKTDRWFLDGDVRNTRLTLSFAGPKLDNDMKVGATVEADFFGGFNGTGGFSNAQEIPRLRLGYVDLVRGKTTIRIGQAWSPMFGNVALSYSHIAFPLGYGAAGDVGWRFPGLYIYHDVSPSMKFTLGVFRNTWNGPGNNVDSGSAGQASTLPQIEARVDWNGKKGANTWSSYVVGHVDKKDLSGAGVKSANDSLTGWAAEFGAKLTSGAFMIQGNAYTGKAIGQQFGQISQFGDIKSWGAWAQGGYSFTKRWAGYVFVGMDKPKKADVIAAKQPRSKNQMVVPSLMYNVGPYGFNVEWLHDRVTTVAATGAETNTKGDQIAASVIYKF